jgi:predicted nucleic acid-binding protein
LSGYLDASVMLPMLIKEPSSAAVDAFMATVQPELWVSDFAAAEVASAISRLVRTGRLQAIDAAARLSEFDIWRAAMTSSVDIQASDARLAYIYVRRLDLHLRAPDALHVAIARRLDVALVTLDRRMATAATELGVTVEMPTKA